MERTEALNTRYIIDTVPVTKFLNRNSMCGGPGMQDTGCEC